jgi:hypothetical protein
VFFDQIQKMFGGSRQFNPGASVSAAANQAQIAAAVTDATCTESADLAGIYFAVQASYEQQIVNANQVALTSAVQQYKAAYAKELKKLPSLLKTAKVTAFPPPPRPGTDNVMARSGPAGWQAESRGAADRRQPRSGLKAAVPDAASARQRDGVPHLRDVAADQGSLLLLGLGRRVACRT